MKTLNFGTVSASAILLALIFYPALLEAREPVHHSAHGFAAHRHLSEKEPKAPTKIKITSSGGRWLTHFSNVVMTQSVLNLCVLLLKACWPSETMTLQLFQMPILMMQVFHFGGQLVYMSVESDTLADKMRCYLVGLCAMQVMVDTTRFFVADSRNWPFPTVSFLILYLANYVFGFSLPHSLDVPRKMAMAFSIATVILCTVSILVLRLEMKDKRKTVLGSLVNLALLGMCFAAYFVTRKAGFVPRTKTKILFYFTFSSSILSQILGMFILVRSPID